MSHPVIHIPRIEPTPDGGTTWTTLDIPLSVSKSTLSSSTPGECYGVVFRVNSGAYDYDFHTAPREQYVVSLSGAVEITTTNGETKTLRGGEPMYVQDVIGKGHKSKAATPESRRSIFVCTKPLDPSLLAHGLTTFDLKTTSECEHTFPVTRVVDTEDGGSKFLDVVVELDQRPIPNNYMSVVFPACDVIFAERTKDSDFHNAPRKHLVIILRGTLEIETTDGQIRQFSVGDVLQNEDTKGRGHKTRAIGGPVLSMWMKVADGQDLDTV